MNDLKIERTGLKGVITTFTGKSVDLNNFKESDVDIHDIAHSLSSMVRFNGHIPVDYTVLDHSLIMSYLVPKEHALEALLHDAGEAYTGDIIYPLKQLFPELEKFEDRITCKIFQSLTPNYNPEWPYEYSKSETIRWADILMVQHEQYMFGRPDGVFSPSVVAATAAFLRDFSVPGTPVPSPFMATCTKRIKTSAFIKRYENLLQQAMQLSPVYHIDLTANVPGRG
jgi:peptidoglycan hydrolase-like protein with peptidoglycan-binding domain